MSYRWGFVFIFCPYFGEHFGALEFLFFSFIILFIFALIQSFTLRGLKADELYEYYPMMAVNVGREERQKKTNESSKTKQKNYGAAITGPDGLSNLSDLVSARSDEQKNDSNYNDDNDDLQAAPTTRMTISDRVTPKQQIDEQLE